MSTDKRSNLWEVILYLDSLPENFIEIIEDTRVPCILSPCHNLDVYNKLDYTRAQNEIAQLCVDNGIEYYDDFDYLYGVANSCRIPHPDCYTLYRLLDIRPNIVKKCHYHLLVNYGTGANKSLKQVQEDFCIPLNALKYPSIVKSERGYVRYLIHLDHPDKAQYRLDEVRCFNGYYASDYFDISNREMDDLCVNVVNFISQNDIKSYAELEIACRVYRPWHKYVTNHTIFLSKLFESLQHGLYHDEIELAEIGQKITQNTNSK